MSKQFVWILMAGSLAVRAQSGITVEGWQRGHSYLLVENGGATAQQGDWRPGGSMRQYAAAHAGSYLLFEDAGTLRRLDDQAAVSEMRRLYAPLRALGTQQQALGRQQQALGKEQQAFGEAQRSAATPQQQVQIGAEQTRIGAVQTKIGAEQSEIGRQQAIAGVAFYKHVEASIDACLERKTCLVVTTLARNTSEPRE